MTKSQSGQPGQLAEVNVARLRAPLDGPGMASLTDALDDVNWLAERSGGFVWRMKATGGPLVMADLAGVGEVAVTVSVWETFEDLSRYVFRSAHALFMAQRVRWFVPIGGFTTSMWWVSRGHEPGVDEALARLVRLRAEGPTPDAFSLRRRFGPDGLPVEA